MTELPLVVLNVQRGGPSKGLPTKTEQGDLLQAMFGRNGESPVCVIAPTSPSDCFDMAIEACRLAVRAMTPVFILSEGFLANSAEREIWPYPGYDCQARQQEIVKLLETGCPQVEFVPVLVATPADATKALALKESVDGFLVYAMTLNWSLTPVLVQISA